MIQAGFIGSTSDTSIRAHAVTRRMSLCFPFSFTRRERYHWFYVGLFYPKPMLWPVAWALPFLIFTCCPWGRKSHTVCKWIVCRKSSFGQFKEGECWSLLTGGWRGGRIWSLSGPDVCLLGLVSWRAEYVLVPDGPMPSLSGTDHRWSRQKGYLRRKTYFPY